MRDESLITVEDFLWAEQPIEMADLLDCAGRDPASWRAGDLPATPTLRYLILGMDFAASAPRRWRTLRMRFLFPDLTQEELAVMLGVTARTVRNHLQPVRLAEVDEFFNKDLMAPDAEPIKIIEV